MPDTQLPSSITLWVCPDHGQTLNVVAGPNGPLCLVKVPERDGAPCAREVTGYRYVPEAAATSTQRSPERGCDSCRRTDPVTFSPDHCAHFCAPCMARETSTTDATEEDRRA